METVLTRFRDTLENDIYVPIYAKSALSNNFTPASVFLSRQFWSSVKLLDNLSKWQGLLSDRPLQALALDALLTRYVLLGIRLAPDLSESVERTKGVVNVLPRAWLSRENGTDIPSGLQQLCRCLVLLVQTADCTIAANRIAIPEISNVLRTIGFKEEAQIILRKYS